MQPGDWATWVGSTFAAIAAGATLWTLKSQRDQIDEQREFIAEQSATMELERAELSAVAADRRVAQARRVVMSSGMLASTWVNGVPGPDDRWKAIVDNYSDAPVHNVEVRFGSAYSAAEAHQYLRGNAPAEGERLPLPIDLLGPNRAALILSPTWPPAAAHNNRPTLYFTDDNGVRWSLDSYGKLKESDQQPGA
ncbi:hypothetical protein [Streptomyces sp. NPDC051665]|uniref:hypothetical protein n=1 Tax=Streptomyces sp. NPDC051665 TaxID=3154647 RepID=UPI0034162DA9